MNITVALVLLILGLGLVVIGILQKKKAKTRQVLVWIGAVGIVIYVLSLVIVGLPLVGTVIYSSALGIPGTTLTVGGEGAGNGGTPYQGYQPTASYSTVNHFNATVITGTSYYKAGSQKATTTQILNTDPNVQYQYWVSATGQYVIPISFTGSGTKTVVNTNAYQNGSITINGYDLIADKAITSGIANASLGTGTAKIKFTVLGSALTTGIPFGGVLVVEANNTISQINCFGDGISAVSGSKYQLTWQPTTANLRYVYYELASGYDVSPDGLIGITKTFECDFVAPASPGTTLAPYYVRIVPTNYYYVNPDGSFALDVEQKLNGLTTRTGLGQFTGTFYWAA